jgi:hypothetical protein
VFAELLELPGVVVTPSNEEKNIVVVVYSPNLDKSVVKFSTGVLRAMEESKAKRYQTLNLKNRAGGVIKIDLTK